MGEAEAITLEFPIHVSAPSKIILHGEHSVVYGKLAVAVSLGLRMNIKLTPNAKALSLCFSSLNIQTSWSFGDLEPLFSQSSDYKTPQEITEERRDFLFPFLKDSCKGNSLAETALLAFLFLYTSILDKPLLAHVDVETDIPIGGGMGSSASYAVSIAASLLIARKAITTPHFTNSDLSLISKWAYMSEKIVHGTPSGIDNTVCTYGGTISFEDGTMTALTTSQSIRILLVNTKVSRNTKALVSKVADYKTKHPKCVESILDAMHHIAQEALQLLTSKTLTGKHYEKLEELISMNHSLLASLGLSHPSLEQITMAARSHNLHAKLTGAGGGGLAFVLVRPDVNNEALLLFKMEMEEAGFEVWETDIGVDGVCREL